MACIFDFFMTESYNYYQLGQLDSERDWFVNNVWDDIDDDAAITSIHESMLLSPSSYSLADRLDECEQSLANNFDNYDSSDCCIILDHTDTSDAVSAYFDQAGESRYKACIINYNADFYSFDNSFSKPARRYLGLGPGHVFSAERSDGGILSTDEVSYMYEPLNSPYCFENGSADEARSFYANCAEDRIKSKNDNC